MTSERRSETGADEPRPERKLVTFIFEITDMAAFHASGNHMNPKCEAAQLPGLKCIGFSIGDLLAMAEDFENADLTAYEKSHEENVLKYLT